MTLPPPSPAASRYFSRNVAVPRSRRERLLQWLRRPRLRLPTADDPLALLLFSALENEPIGGYRLHELRSVATIDEDQDGRRRLLAFLFKVGGETPFAIAKAQTDLRSGSLQHEEEALSQAAALLPPQLRGTIPEVLRCDISARGEVLVVSALPGRSAWFDLKSALLPSRLVDGHFEAAGRWLAAFHEATRHDALTAAKHGDYWAHNVLRDDTGRVGVVDWENFATRASRFVDLFHYALTYGLAYPWRLYRSLPADAAFVNTFLERTRVSRAVRNYLRCYAAETGVSSQTLRNSFGDFLATRGTMDDSSPALPGVRELPWERFAERFRASGESVFT